jgi:hypothetical protein
MSDNTGKTAATVAVGIGLTILNIVCPPAGIAVTSAVVAAGATAKLTGNLEDNEEKKALGEVLTEGGTIGGLTSGGSVNKLWAVGGASAGSGPVLLGGGMATAYNRIKEEEERKNNK